MSDEWYPAPTVMEERHGVSGLSASDFPACTEPAFSRRSVDILRDLLEPNGQILPVYCSQEEYFIYNVTNLLPALDMANSIVEYFDDSDRIMYIKRYSFQSAVIANTPIFKLSEWPSMFPLVTRSFVERVQKYELVGFDFQLLTQEHI